MSKVAKTAPTIFSSVYGVMEYAIVQDFEQFRTCKTKCYRSISDSHSNDSIENSTANTWMMEHSNSGKQFCVIHYPYMFEDSEDVVLRVLCHESVHVWQNFIDVIYDQSPSREFEAYTIDEMFSNVLSEYRRLLAIHKEEGKKKTAS